ncbi:hypothetical protein EDB81DRAFT_752300 [Dactylonectria macrodidyma]|uniref:Uncharacterized protein n=1 Tax=Dactylonectria macrodidyma TaxID=307937 RepID=A0A9P9FVV2_9HYPO|nr:hypothetical protein EDB81DRAFT_752300 [Dactylonectria macrodidyma]
MDPLGGAAVGLQLALKTAALIAKLQQAEESAKTFISLRNAVKRDHEYALALLEELTNPILRLPTQREWILHILIAAKNAISAFDKPLSHAPGGNGKATIGDKTKYVLWYAEQTVEMQVSLSVSHASLLQAINLMHQFAVKPGGPLAREPSDPQRASTVLPRRADGTQFDLSPADLGVNLAN